MFALKYAANQKEMLRRIKDLNRNINNKANLVEDEDIEMVNLLKQEVQDIEDKCDMAITRKNFVQMQLEGEKPTRFFCKMNRKRLPRFQFKELHVEEVDENSKRL